MKYRGLIICVALMIGCACHEEKRSEKVEQRFNAVESNNRAATQNTFCERTFPSQGQGSRKWSSPVSRPVPKSGSAADSKSGGASESKENPDSTKPRWMWINLWASWCVPCIEEMPLLERWRSSLEKDGLPVRFELWSIDTEESDLKSALSRKFPGEVKWLRSDSDLPAVLEGLGLDKNAAIPVHALVNPSGMIRCARVGSVHEDAYGPVKSILTGG